MLTNNLFKWFCVLLGSLLLTNEAVAQNKIQTKFICNSCDIKKLEDSVSIKYGYRLYYDVNEFEGFTFSVNMDNALIEQLINQIFSTTSFKYSLDTFSRIFLSKKEFIKTSLPPNLFIEKRF